MKQIQTDNQYIDEMDKRYKEITTQVKKFEQQRVSEKPTAFYGTHTKSRGPSTTDFDETLRVLDVFAAQITEVQFSHMICLPFCSFNANCVKNAK